MSDNQYGKRPLWQWIVFYLVIAGIVYAGVYFVFFSKGGGPSYIQPVQGQSQPVYP